MYKIVRLSLLAFLSIVISMPLFAHEKELKSILNNKELKRISSAEKLIAKGDAVIKQAEDLETEIEKLKNDDGRIKTGKINKRSKQVAEKKVKASLYFNEGYKKYIDVLDDRLKEPEKAGNSIAKQTREDIKHLEKKARKQYNKAKNLASAEKMVELIELAQENQRKAIELQSKCLLSLREEYKEEPALVTAEEQIVKDTISTPEPMASAPKPAPVGESNIRPVEVATPVIAASTLTEIGEQATASEAVPKQAARTEPVIKAEFGPVSEAVEAPIIKQATAHSDVFFTIQLTADKKKATDTQIANMYNGNKDVIEMNDNDWYKYSVGKYRSLEEAKADMKAENITGFIVAYNKKQRISVKKAVSLLNEGL